MKKGIFLIGFITLATLLLSQELKEDIPKIQKVHNTLEEIQKLEGRLKLELIYEWSSEDEMDENKILYEPKDVAISEEGNIYILAANWIKIFDKSRKHLRTIGGAGQGPGEFLEPDYIEFDRDKNIVVMDSDNHRIQILSQEGVYLGGFADLGNQASSSIAITQKNGILMLNRTRTTKPSSLWLLYDYKGQILDERGERKSTASIHVTSRYYSFSFILDEEDNLYAAAEFRTLLRIYSSTGELNLESTYEVPFEVPKIKMIDAYVVEAERVANGMDIDSQGRMFVLALTRQETSDESVIGWTTAIMSRDGKSTSGKVKFDVDSTKTDLYQILVFDNTGKIVASKKMNIYANNIRIFGDKLFLIDTHVNMKILEYRFTVE